MNKKKTRQMAQKYSLPVVAVLVRGGTGHRKDLCLEDGSIIHLYPDGDMEKSEYTHKINPTEIPGNK